VLSEPRAAAMMPGYDAKPCGVWKTLELAELASMKWGQWAATCLALIFYYYRNLNRKTLELAGWTFMEWGHSERPHV